MYQQPNLIGTSIAPTSNHASSINKFLPKLQKYRSAGPIEEYMYDSIKPKKKLKEIRKILFPQKKQFFKIKYGYKFNFKDICIVCGTHHVWEAGDYLRPPIPLDNVTKGRPLRGTYCQKHAGVHKQMEMLQQQILAEENGLDFKAFIPRARLPQIMKRGPFTTLTKDEVVNHTSTGWLIKPPTMTDSETTMSEIVRLVAEIGLSTERLNFLLGNTKEE